jgi:hypothetical protein
MDKILKSGEGWRLGWNPQAEIHRGLVGSDDWAIELSESELDDFCRLLNQLATTMAQMAEELMEEERIACEAQSDLLWMEVEGYPEAYSLRFILNEGRRGEGFWPARVVPELIAAARVLKVF